MRAILLTLIVVGLAVAATVAPTPSNQPSPTVHRGNHTHSNHTHNHNPFQKLGWPVLVAILAGACCFVLILSGIGFCIYRRYNQRARYEPLI